MSATHPGESFAAAKQHGLASDHPQLMPFLVAVAVHEDRSVSIPVLFDPDRGLSERIIAEQFTV